MTIPLAPPRTDRRRTATLALAGALVLGGTACTGPVPGDRAAAVDPAVPPAPATTTATDAPAPPSPPEETGVSGLDPELAERFAAAQRAAAADGIELRLVSGARTAEEQQVLVDQAVEKYGVPEAYRWVLPPEESAHVQGLAIDVGPTEGTYWLVEHGLEHGLCQTYANEVWHFELLPDGADTCPEQHADASWAW
jgi:D-alanyl-D-alanine dipeptidase